MENISNLKGIVIAIVVIGIVFGIGFLILEEFLENKTSTITGFASSKFLIPNGTTSTLSQTPSSGVSVTVKNDTWLSFDGVNDEIGAFNYVENLNHSFSFWFNASNKQKNTYNAIIFGGATQEMIAIRNDANGKLVYVANNGTSIYINSSTALNDSLWHHAVTILDVNGRNMSLFIDGVFQNWASLLGGTMNNQVTSFTIGDKNGARSINGSIDEVKYYNRTISQTEISEIYNSGRIANKSLNWTGLVLWLPLNEGTGLNVTGYNQTDFD